MTIYFYYNLQGVGEGAIVDKKLPIYGLKICRKFLLMGKCLQAMKNINVALRLSLVSPKQNFEWKAEFLNFAVRAQIAYIAYFLATK